jgi:hypothetical protein
MIGDLGTWRSNGTVITGSLVLRSQGWLSCHANHGDPFASSQVGSCERPSAPFVTVQRIRSVTKRKRLSERVLKLLKHLRLGFE